MPYYFSLEIKASEGLLGIENYLDSCKVELEVCESNGKILLKNKVGSNF